MREALRLMLKGFNLPPGRMQVLLERLMREALRIMLKVEVPRLQLCSGAGFN